MVQDGFGDRDNDIAHDMVVYRGSLYVGTHNGTTGAEVWRDSCACDLNHDGKCDMLDWLLFGQDWGRTNCGTPPGSGNPPNGCECDLDKDGKCDMLDWLLFGEDWGRTDCPIP
jgi:hypothetical protein